jgi:alkylation response protein AidB-like acyl-CoA dehydrogenase
MDLELTDEQIWLSESLTTLLGREWVGPGPAHEAGGAERERLWRALVDFGVLSVDPEEGLGAVELCLASRAMGAHLASTPFLDSAALRYAVVPFVHGLPEAFAELGDDRVAIALLEPGRGWAVAGARTALGPEGIDGRKVAVAHADEADRLAVVASAGGAPVLALVGAAGPGVHIEPQPALDVTVPMSAVELSGVPATAVAEGEPGQAVLSRLTTVGALLAAAESVGAAGRMLEDACAYAAERRQFGRAIASYQALRHLLADMHVRRASAWSTVLYAAAALDDDLPEALLTAAVAKAYVARAAREVAHGALQVFGGIAFTLEHPAHRFLRRIVVRERQFGDAAHHEREIGRALAARAGERAQAHAAPTVTSAAAG